MKWCSVCMQPEHSLSGMLCALRKAVTSYCSGDGDNKRQAMFRVDFDVFPSMFDSESDGPEFEPTDKEGTHGDVKLDAKGTVCAR